MEDGCAKSPRYVLKDGPHPIGPPILQASSDAQTTVIFGFSDKPEYDVFLKSSASALTPYPLVKRFLQNQMAIDVDLLKLIVLDATSSQEPILYAATFQSVLESFQLDSERLAITHQLILETSSHLYRIQKFADAASESFAS